MKNLFGNFKELTALFMLCAGLTGSVALAEGGHQGHAKHNMLLYGSGAVYASHIVYKAPHNYQVILQLMLDDVTWAQYNVTRSRNANGQVYLLLDAMDLKDIESVEQLSGSMIYEDPSGARQVVQDRVILPKANFKVIYWNELPLSLESHSMWAGEARSLVKDPSDAPTGSGPIGLDRRCMYVKCY